MEQCASVPQDVTVYSFPGIGFVGYGDQHHFELLRCRVTYPENQHRSITATGGGLAIQQSQGFIRLEDCDFGYTGDDCVSIGDGTHSEVQRLDDHTLLVKNIVTWSCPFSAGDPVEIRNGDFSPTGFTGKVVDAKPGDKNALTLVFDQELPSHVASDAILFNHRYGSRNCTIRNCYFHENRARGVLCDAADWLIEGNRFFHNQMPAMLIEAEVGTWYTGFGAQNVLVRGNKFESANSDGGVDGTAVSVSVNGYPTSYPLLENILFENNVFQEMTGPAIAAASF